MSGPSPEWLSWAKEATKIIQWAQSTPYDETSIEHLGGILAEMVHDRVQATLGRVVPLVDKFHNFLTERTAVTREAEDNERYLRLLDKNYLQPIILALAQPAAETEKRSQRIRKGLKLDGQVFIPEYGPPAEPPCEHVHTPDSDFSCCSCGWSCDGSCFTDSDDNDECERQWKEHIARAK